MSDEFRQRQRRQRLIIATAIIAVGTALSLLSLWFDDEVDPSVLICLGIAIAAIRLNPEMNLRLHSVREGCPVVTGHSEAFLTAWKVVASQTDARYRIDPDDI